MNGRAVVVAVASLWATATAPAQEAGAGSGAPAELPAVASPPVAVEQAEPACEPQPECELVNSKFAPGIPTSVKNSITLHDMDMGTGSTLTQELNVDSFFLPASPEAATTGTVAQDQ